ncbi:hypothetical protein BRARA_G00817 [Brassica rapa]|uniref:Uncharacterized protein n=1 Tax=Brassica campestris TaxID=3711 RepID=A0A397YN93_BRACM|nr:hypothetical protein BRARA_G00817 [Brassica rapa]
MEAAMIGESLTGIVWQGFFLGAMRVVFCASSLTFLLQHSGVLISVLLRVTEVLAVLCFREKFQPEKGQVLDKPQPPETELPPLPVSVSVVA